MNPKNMGPEMGMNMMKKMLGGDDAGPMQMCKDMISTIGKTSEMSAFSTPELHSLFSDWLDSKDQDVLDAMDKSRSYELNEIAKLLDLSTESAAYLLARMATNEDIVLQVKKKDSTKKAPKAK